MALIFGDSFDHYSRDDILKKWTSTTGTTIATGSCLPEPYGLTPHAYCLYARDAKYLDKVLVTALATFVAGFWYKSDSVTAAQIIFTGQDSATPANIHVSLRSDATGHLTFCRDATVLATSTNTLSTNTWYHIEIKATIGDAPNGAYEVRVDGSPTNWIAAATGADTRNSGNATIGAVRLYGGTNIAAPGSHLFQDFYLLDTTGAQASDFLGPSRFAVLRPVSAGNSAEWAGNPHADNFVNVSEYLADGDTSFNEDTTAGHVDTFGLSDVPAGTIHAIQHVIMARKDAGAARTIRPITRIGGTDYAGTTVSLSAGYVFLTEPVMFSPATGGATAFDDAELDGAEGGYELVS